MGNWISLSEACEILGLSTNTVKKLVRKGILPAYEIKGVRGPRFHPEDVERLIKRVEPTEAKPSEKTRKKPR